MKTNAKMTYSTRLKLASIPRSVCFKCHSKRIYTNPMEKCFECKKKFCFDCINCLQVNSKTKMNEEVKNVCDVCKEKHHYKKLG